MNTINFPTLPVPSKVARAAPTTTSPFPSTPNQPTSLLNLHPFTKKKPLFLTLCSSKAYTTEDNNATDKYPTNEFDPSSPTQQQQTNQAIPISNLPQPPPSLPLSAGLVFDLSPINESWDSFEVGSPVVKRFLSDDEERWYMWYHGRSNSNKNLGSDSVGVATSSNGIHWERGRGKVESSSSVGLVMSCGEDWWAFDTKGIRPSQVMVMSSNKIRSSSGVYWLYYTGFSNTEEMELRNSSLDFKFPIQNPEEACNGDKVLKSLPGLAISQDGRYWARIEGDHHSGALFDVGSQGEWDSLFIASPHVVFHSAGDIRMYYHSFDPNTGKFAIGLARSRDGIKWIKLGKTTIEGFDGCGEGGFDEMGMMNPCVVRNKKDGKYLMAYEGVSMAGKKSIGIAVSCDGLKEWKKVKDGAVFEAGIGGWDCKGVGNPCLVEMDGCEDEDWRLYYKGVNEEGKTGIGMAVNDGKEIITRFRRWTGFHI